MLSDLKLRSAKPKAKVYCLQDGEGLYLEVRPSGVKSWRYRYWMDANTDGRIVLGHYPDMTLTEARKERERLRSLVASGVNPQQAKQTAQVQQAVLKAITFKLVAEEWLARQALKWTPRYLQQATRCLQLNAFPLIGDLPIRAITSAHILHLLREMESRGASTYGLMLRQWLSGVFRYSIITLRADTDPTAALAGYLQRSAIQHSTPMPLPLLREVLLKLDTYQGARQTALAIKLLAHTFVRTIELLGATWEEFGEQEWRVPAGRMKMKREHLVPLSTQVQETLRELRSLTGKRPYVFPNRRNRWEHMNTNSLNRALDYLGKGEWTGHDFRATASTHLHEMGYRPDVIERQLAHIEVSRTKRAYNRAEYLPERQVMMQAWSDLITLV